MEQRIYNDYVRLLERELVPAMGCTEPIAVAYAAASAVRELGVLPDKVDICVSANIIKNVKSVIVPATGGMHGIEAAVAAGLTSVTLGPRILRCETAPSCVLSAIFYHAGEI